MMMTRTDHCWIAILGLATGAGLWFAGVMSTELGVPVFPDAGATVAAEPMPPPMAEPVYDQSRSLQYSFSVRNPGNGIFEQVELRAYAPVSRTSAQHCCENLVTSHPYIVETDPHGNQLLRFDLGTLPPFGHLIVRIRAVLQLASEPQALPGDDPSAYLGEERYVESTHPELVKKAMQLRVEGDDVATARRIHEWVAKNLEDSGYNRDARGALYTLRSLKGDCTEAMHLFMALARAAGVPARGVGGYVYDRDVVLDPREYHNWAEFHDGTAWRVADPNRRVFMENEQTYLAMQIMAGDVSAVVGGARYVVNAAGLEVRMNQ